MSKERINQANGRLKFSRVGVAIEQIKERLFLVATLPPKPESTREKPYQQRIALHIYANGAGIKKAEQEARKIGVLLASGEFSWKPFFQKPELSISDWIEKSEAIYFETRERNAASLSTWEGDYLKIFKLLPSGNLSEEILRETIIKTSPNSRTRRRAALACAFLADCADLPSAALRSLVGNYSPSHPTPRDLPCDGLIAKTFDRIKNPSWRWAYSVMACYGLRNHEIWLIDLEEFPLAFIDRGKTKERYVYPFYPEWAEEWEVFNIKVPLCTGKNNSDLGNRLTTAFSREEIPFPPLHLRHAWAVRSLEFGLDISLAAQQMGHSVKVHSEIYHHWISKETHKRAYEVLINRSDRPLPP